MQAIPVETMLLLSKNKLIKLAENTIQKRDGKRPISRNKYP